MLNQYVRDFKLYNFANIASIPRNANSLLKKYSHFNIQHSFNVLYGLIDCIINYNTAIMIINMYIYSFVLLIILYYL